MDHDLDLTSDLGELDSAPVAAPAGSVPASGADSRPVNDAPAMKAGKPEFSLRDQLSAAFKPQQPAEEAAPGQPRDPNGKFLPKDTQPTADAPTAPSPEAVQAPAWFQPAEAQQFAALPVEMQQFVARTMANVEQMAQKYTGYQQLEAVIGQRREAWAVNGMTEAQAVNQLLALSDFATRSPADFVQWFATNNGVDLDRLAYGEPNIDPTIAELRNQVQQLQGQLGQVTQGQQQREHESLVQRVASFAQETDTAGQPLRPYFQEVAQSIPAYLQNVLAEQPGIEHTKALSEAYERAVWATPAIRQKMLDAQEATRLQAQRANVAKAKAASASVTSAAPDGGSSVPNNESRTVRDELRSAFAHYKA